jgi:phenylacetate-CoA ligase
VNAVESNEEIELAELESLVADSNRRLPDVVSRACESPLYRDLWRAADVHAGRVHGLADLPLLPLLTRERLFQATRSRRSAIACGPVAQWFAGSSRTSAYEWFPYGIDDFLGIAPLLARLARVVGLRDGDIVLAVKGTSPRIDATIPYLWTRSENRGLPRFEWITGSLDWYDSVGMTWIDFVQKRRPTVLFTSTENALALADKIRDDLGVRAADVLTRTRIGVFYGGSSSASQQMLAEAYSLESFEIYSPTEHMALSAECTAHEGIHLWMDTCIPELVPVDGTEAVPVWETTPGTTGELVLTTFARCLPLVRLRTGESIRVEGIDRCACGRTHPRISRLPRGRP